MKTLQHVTGTIALGLAAAMLSGCRTYQPGVSSSRRTLLSDPDTAVATTPATVTTLPSNTTPAQPSYKPVPNATPSFAPKSVAVQTPSITASSSSNSSVNVSQPSAPSVAMPSTPTAVVPSVPTTAAPTTIVDYAIYTVKPGDTAGVIANSHGMTLDEFKKLNNLTNPDNIRIGQTLKIAKGRTALAAGPAVRQPVKSGLSTDGSVYVVEPGDSLSKIAARCGVPLVTLAQRNNISDVNSIRPGQKLYITGAAPTAPATSTSAWPTNVVKTPAKVATTAERSVTPPAKPVELPVVAPVSAVKSPAVVAPTSTAAPEPKKPNLLNDDVVDSILGGTSIEDVKKNTASAVEKAVDTAASSGRAAVDEALEPVKEVVSTVKKHTVTSSDDDIYSIALEYNISPLKLRELNPNIDTGNLKPGQTLIVSEGSN